MKRRLTPEERRLWSKVARTMDAVRPGMDPSDAEASEGRAEPPPSQPPKPPAEDRRAAAAREEMNLLLAQLAAGVRHAPAPRPATRHARHAPEELEPRRLRRLSRERDPIEARIDLHGFGVWEAEDRLKAFILRSWDQGLRAVLVVTGKGYGGEGQIRRHAHEWLAARDLRHAVAGVSHAARRHGGEGALYVALKRRPA